MTLEFSPNKERDEEERNPNERSFCQPGPAGVTISSLKQRVSVSVKQMMTMMMMMRRKDILTSI